MKVNLLYAHRADPSTPIDEQIQSFNDQIAQGRCKSVSTYTVQHTTRARSDKPYPKWGISNTTPAVLENILKLCDEKGWQKPSSYQGDYNLVTRAMETKLLPILRAHNMTFVAFRYVFLVQLLRYALFASYRCDILRRTADGIA